MVKGQMESVRNQTEWRINKLKEIHMKEVEALDAKLRTQMGDVASVFAVRLKL
jgi:hypothetical protein